MKTDELILSENKLTKDGFNLDEILEFQLENDIQIIRGSDYRYMCYINNKVYATGLTPMFAFVFGIKAFKNLKKLNII